jgi:hypothetical protein
VEIKSGAEHREIPTEHAAVETGSAPNNRHRGWNLAAGRRGEPKELTRGNCGSRRKLTRRAGEARCKGHVVRKNQTRNGAGRGISRGRICRRHLTRQEGSKGIKDLDGIRPLYIYGRTG